MKKTHITNLYGMAGDSTVLLAQNAVQKVAAELGYRELGIYFYNVESDTPLERQKRMDGIIASISFGDIVVFQSPTWNGIVYDREFMDKLCGLNCKIVLFIHDVVPLMFDSNYYLMAEYMGIYNRADVVIVPSEQMKERLISEGLTVATILVQKMWDHPHQMSLHAPQFRKEIFFAGSLDRFPDLQHWTYSTPLRVFSDTGHEFAHDTLHIEGWRKDEELLLELSKGGFGLVWGTHENEGENNNYYHMNISYKVSTYLAAGIPVLIPSYLSNAEMIVEHGWGLVVDSLEEAHHIVDTMSEETYQTMCQKVESLSYLLKEGYFSKKLLVDAVFQLGMQ